MREWDEEHAEYRARCRGKIIKKTNIARERGREKEREREGQVKTSATSLFGQIIATSETRRNRSVKAQTVEMREVYRIVGKLRSGRTRRHPLLP